jgi:uncharacterized protein YbjT (DUF2867 family)
MNNILITGGTGLLGRTLSRVLNDLKLKHTIASRNNEDGNGSWVYLDILKKEGLETLRGRDIIFHLAHDLKQDSALTKNLINALQNNANTHLVYVSIVGIDDIPLHYYKEKSLSEKLIINSGIPFSILRATQFHEFVERLIKNLLIFPVGFIPKKNLMQPIQVEIVAHELIKISERKPSLGRTNLGGKEILQFGKMAELWSEKSGNKKTILNFPLWGKLGRALHSGKLTTKEANQDSITWEEWLDRKYK